MANNKNFFKDLDIYGRPIGLMFQGEEVWRTEFGSCCTLLTYIIVLIFATTSILRFTSSS